MMFPTAQRIAIPGNIRSRNIAKTRQSFLCIKAQRSGASRASASVVAVPPNGLAVSRKRRVPPASHTDQTMAPIGGSIPGLGARP